MKLTLVKSKLISHFICYHRNGIDTTSSNLNGNNHQEQNTRQPRRLHNVTLNRKDELKNGYPQDDFRYTFASPFPSCCVQPTLESVEGLATPAESSRRVSSFPFILFCFDGLLPYRGKVGSCTQNGNGVTSVLVTVRACWQYKFHIWEADVNALCYFLSIFFYISQGEKGELTQAAV